MEVGNVERTRETEMEGGGGGGEKLNHWWRSSQIHYGLSWKQHNAEVVAMGKVARWGAAAAKCYKTLFKRFSSPLLSAIITSASSLPRGGKWSDSTCRVCTVNMCVQSVCVTTQSDKRDACIVLSSQSWGKQTSGRSNGKAGWRDRRITVERPGGRACASHLLALILPLSSFTFSRI